MNATLETTAAICEERDGVTCRKGVRTLRLGLLGAGNVGGALLREIVASCELLTNLGLRIDPIACLVRDASRPRRSPVPTRVLDNPAEFLRGEYDVVVEVLGGVEPARSLVTSLLERGTSVVTANKSLLAACGRDLRRIAERHGSALRCEASVVAGVPFLGALRERPLSARVDRLVGVVNGTSNYVLTRVERDRASIAEAVRSAAACGFAEPNAEYDVSGRDAAEKLVVLLQHVGVCEINTSDLEVRGIDELHSDDLAQARVFGGAIKPVVFAEIDRSSVRAFVGPCFVPASHALASLEEEQNALCLSRKGQRDVTFSGPGAGPAVTAATVLDDVIDIAERGSVAGFASAAQPPRSIAAPRTAWLLRATFPAGRVQLESFGSLLARQDVRVRGLFGVRGDRDADRLYCITRPCDGAALGMALSAARGALSCETLAIRAIV